MTAFIGEATVAFTRFAAGTARFRRSDLFLTMQQCGAQALPRASSCRDAPAPHSPPSEVNIVRFEGAPGKSVLLKAQWAIFNGERDVSFYRQSVISEKAHGDTYEAFVAAMSKALAGLGGDIADAISVLN